MQMIILLVVMGGMMLFMSSQQRKQAQNRQNQLNAIKAGDEVVTIGGLYAVVDEVDKDNQKITLDCDGVYLVFELSAIKRVVSSEVVSEDSSETIEEEVGDTLEGELVD